MLEKCCRTDCSTWRINWSMSSTKYPKLIIPGAFNVGIKKSKYFSYFQMQLTLFYFFLSKQSNIFNHKVADSFFFLTYTVWFQIKEIFLYMRPCLSKVQKEDVKPGYMHTKKENLFVRSLERKIWQSRISSFRSWYWIWYTDIIVKI